MIAGTAKVISKPFRDLRGDFDQRDDDMSNKVMPLANPSQPAEKAGLLKGRNVTFPAEFASEVWCTAVVESILFWHCPPHQVQG